MIKILKFSSFDMNIKDTQIAYGYPSLFSFHGFLKNLELILNKQGFNIKINEYIPFIESVKEREGRSSLGKDSVADGLLDMPRALVSGSLVFKIEGEAENIEKTILKVLKKMRLGGGRIETAYFLNPKDHFRIYGFYPKIDYKEFNLTEIIVLNSLYYQKGVNHVLRIGEKILTTLQNKNKFGYNINISTAIYSKVSQKRLKEVFTSLESFEKDFFRKNKLYVVKNNNEIIIKTGEKND